MLRRPKRRRPEISAPIPPRDTPPAVNELDHQIGAQKGSTSVLELSPQQVQLAKLRPTPDLSTRVEELTRELGRMRHEIQFYRQCFGILQRLRDESYNVYQQLFLAHYHDDPDRLDELMTQMHRALEQSVRLETEAKKAWLDFWGIDLNGHDMDSRDEDEQVHGNWI